jgi:hypothetical protein
MTVRVIPSAMADAVRANPGFKAYTNGLEKRAEAAGKATARAKGLKRRTGRYEDSFRAKFRPGRGDVLGLLTLENEQEHSTFIEAGTRPHVILPRRARVLVFQVAGRTVFARRVNHPGTKARWVVRDALRLLGRTRVNP